jgi:hypothetical protein
MPKLFGFKIEEPEDKSSKIISPVPPNDEDKSDFYLSSGFYGQYVDIEGVYKSEGDLVRRYREMALHPEVDSAIEDVVNEAIVSDSDDSPLQIDLSNLPASDKLKDKIREEFKYIKEIMDFDKKCHEIFRNWYIDGRIFYHKVIDLEKPQEGIKEIRYIDPLKIRLIRRLKKDQKDLRTTLSKITSGDNSVDFNPPEIEEFYLYNPNQLTSQGSTTSSSGNFRNDVRQVRISKDAISYITSGLVDRNKQTVLSHLHKAIKALNQLRMIEDSLVIYRLSRAPERRIFYIDVGNLPKIKAEQYLRDVMNRYRNKLVYDANTGEIRDDRKYMAMLEDFWLPRREGGRGTEISTLPGGQNLGELADIEYFQKKLYRSLNVPETRLNSSGGFSLGRSSEILRDEVKFTKFVGRLRKRFSNIFNDMLKTQLILKNIVTPEDWNVLSDHIQYDYLYDNHFSELKDTELLNDRLTAVAAMEPYIGKYFSLAYVRSNILKQNDGEIKEIDKQIQKEIKAGLIVDPKLVVTQQQSTLQPMDQGMGVDMGQGQDPEQQSSAAMGQPVMEPQAGEI